VVVGIEYSPNDVVLLLQTYEDKNINIRKEGMQPYPPESL
jgi:hypothetical protein